MTTSINPGPRIPEWPHQRPSSRLYLATDQYNLVDTVPTVVKLDTISAGFTDGIEDTTLHRITPGVAGFYHITGLVTLYSFVVDKSYRSAIYISGTNWLAFNFAWPMGGTRLSLPVGGLAKLAATDYVELVAISDSGNNMVDIIAGSYNTFLSVQRVR